MPIPVKCPCGKSLSAPDHLAGKRVKCPGCGNPLAIPVAGAARPAATLPGAKPAPKPAAPSPSKPAPRPAVPAPKPPAARPKPVAARPVPAKPAVAAKPASRPAPAPAPKKAEGGDEDLHDHSSCPSCNSFVSKKDAICIHCGLNLVTGKQLTTVHSKDPTGPPKGVAVLCMILNLLIPGSGTLVGGGAAHRMTGVYQMLTALVGVAFFVLIGMNIPPGVGGWLKIVPAGAILVPLLPILGAVGWALPSSLEILKNAKPGGGEASE